MGMAGPPTKKKNEQSERGAVDRRRDGERKRREIRSARRKAEIKTQHEQHRKLCISLSSQSRRAHAIEGERSPPI